MRNRWKMFAACLVVLLAAITFTTGAPAEAQAKIAISKTSATITKGKTLQLKVKGTKKKITWKSSNKKIAVVTSKGKVTAKKAGKTTISAKVKGGKTYKCKVTVKEAVDYKKNVTITYTKYREGLLAIVKNNNKVAIDIRISAEMYKGSASQKDEDAMKLYCLGAGREAALYWNFYNNDTSSSAMYLMPDSYKINKVTVTKSESTDLAGKITLSDFQVLPNVPTELKFLSLNSSGHKLDCSGSNATVIFYDANNTIISCEWTQLNCDFSEPNKSSEFVLLPLEYPEANGPAELIPYDHYKVYLNSAPQATN